MLASRQLLKSIDETQRSLVICRGGMKMVDRKILSLRWFNKFNIMERDVGANLLKN